MLLAIISSPVSNFAVVGWCSFRWAVHVYVTLLSCFAVVISGCWSVLLCCRCCCQCLLLLFFVCISCWFFIILLSRFCKSFSCILPILGHWYVVLMLFVWSLEKNWNTGDKKGIRCSSGNLFSTFHPRSPSSLLWWTNNQPTLPPSPFLSLCTIVQTEKLK